MDIAFTDEQQLLQDTAARLAGNLAVTGPGAIPSGVALDMQWHRLVELGVPALRARTLSGLDASGVETAIVVEQLAMVLSAVPVVGQAVLATELLDAAGAQEELARVVAGALRVAPTLVTDLTGFGSTGQACVVFDAAGATHALRISRTDGQRRLVCVPLHPEKGDTTDGLDLTRVIRKVPVDPADPGQPIGGPISDERWSRAEALGMIAIAADLLGVMQAALDDAVRYAGDRTQFGVKIGSFQAIQHLLADALVQVEGARSCLWHAAWAIDQLPVDEARLAAMTAKAYASAAGREVIEASAQVFGGIAITWEHVAHLRLRRMLLDRRLLGDESVHYEAIAAARLSNRELA